MSTPQISILMTVFNAEAYLDETIRSIREQTFSDFEFVIVNDGSTDGSAAILDRHAAEDWRIRLFHRENQGRVAVLNYGLSVLQAPLTAIMDADDIALPDRLQKQWRRMVDEPSLGVLGGHVQLIDRLGVSTGAFEYPLDDVSIRQCLKHSSPFAHPASMIRTDLLRQVGGYRAFYKHCEDFDLWLRLAEITRMANLDEVVLRYRLHGQNSVIVHKKALTLGHWLAVGCAEVRKAGMPDPTVGWAAASPALFDTLALPLAERWRLKYAWAMSATSELSVSELPAGKALIGELQSSMRGQVAAEQKENWARVNLIFARRALFAHNISAFMWAVANGVKHAPVQVLGMLGAKFLRLNRGGNSDAEAVKVRVIGKRDAF